MSPAVLADSDNSDFDNMLGMNPRFNTDDVDRAPLPNSATLALDHNEVNLDLGRRMISITPFNSHVNPVVVMNALSETGSRKMGRINSGHTDVVVPDLDRHDERELYMKAKREARNEKSQTRQLQPTEARKNFLRHMHSRNFKYFYSSDRYLNLDVFLLCNTYYKFKSSVASVQVLETDRVVITCLESK
ncbi:unnamed protein product [Orchesella dallaii]|uniref:Uncharacterized protein n=1 Tax=Orchesella dallaii TaxID=48710 RepID=A0ABP1S0X9_9HEXA